VGISKGIIIIALIILMLFAAFVWPTMYRYDKFPSKLVRTNRITGGSEMLWGDGWFKMEPRRSIVEEALSKPSAPPPAPKIEYLGPLSDEELYKAGIKPPEKSAK